MLDLSYFWKKKTILSFLAIIFVVIIHNSASEQYSFTPNFFTNLTLDIRNVFAYGLGAIAVPLFFFLSGFATFRNYKLKLYPQKLKSRVKTLIIPYLIWNTIGLLFAIIYTYTPISNLIAGRESFFPTTSNILEGIFLYKYNFQFWFLYDLIIYTILSPLIYLLIKNKYIGILSSVTILFLPVLFNSPPHLNLNFTIFYFLGCFFSKHFQKIFIIPSSKKVIHLSGLLFFVFLLTKILLNYNILSLSIISSNIILIGLLFSFWFFSDSFICKIKQKKFFSEFFPIYTLHTYFLATIIKIIYYLAPKNSFMLFINEVISTSLTIIVVTILAYYWHKKLPKFYAIMFGSKE